jgi:hypothetical protein
MTERIHSIDALRGLCLINIFINHVTLGRLQELSPSKLAFFDSADVFVLLAGIATFLAYGPKSESFDLRSSGPRMWRRALTLYAANLAIIVASLAVFLIGGLGAQAGPHSNSPTALAQGHGALTYAWHVLTMQQSVGFSMVLRLYVVLLLVAPAYVWLASKRFWYPLVPAAGIWLVSGHFGIASRDSLTGELLSMTLLPWQLVYAAGITIGAAIARGIALPSNRSLAVAAAVVALTGTLVLLVGPYVSPAVHAWLEVRNDHFWTGISKSYQSPLRLLHLAAVAYVIAAFAGAPLIRLVHGARPASLLCRLGRNSLPIFAFGAVFALAVDQMLWRLAVGQYFALGSAGAIAVELAMAAVAIALMSRISDGRRSAALFLRRLGRAAA